MRDDAFVVTRAARWLAVSLCLCATGAFAQAPAGEPLATAVRAYGLASSGFRQGRVPVETVAAWSLRIWTLQKADKAPTADADYLYRAKDLENVATARRKSGDSTDLDVATARFFRFEAEAAVAAAEKPPPPPKKR